MYVCEIARERERERGLDTKKEERYSVNVCEIDRERESVFTFFWIKRKKGWARIKKKPW